MKPRKTTRASFSANPPVIDVQLPAAWTELTQRELIGVYRILVNNMESTEGELLFLLFAYFGGVKVLSQTDYGFRCRFVATEAISGKGKRIICRLTPEGLEQRLQVLRFVFEPGAVPVRPESWHGARAIDAQFHGLTFGEYLQVENLYQGFLMSKNRETLERIAYILYPGIKRKHIDDVFIFALLRWLVQVKNLFAANWGNFFKPANGDVVAESMLESMNNQIRVLTGGDVTKEEQIFATECWRALNELDFKVKDAEELKRQTEKMKK